MDREHCKTCKFFETLEEYEKRTKRKYPTIIYNKKEDGLCHKEPKPQEMEGSNWCSHHCKK